MPALNSAQEIFDTVTKHLFTQGKQASDSHGACQYRTEDGLMCAVGCLISDDEYKPAMDDGNNVVGLLASAVHPWEISNNEYPTEELEPYSWPALAWMNPHKNLLSALQNVHDEDNSWETTGNLRLALEFVAKDFELAFDPTQYAFSDR